jgi:transketolase
MARLVVRRLLATIPVLVLVTAGVFMLIHLTPGDPVEAAAATHAAHAHEGPVYLRLGKNGERRRRPEGARFEIGRAELLRAGGDVTIASCGTALPLALDAAELLAGAGVDAAVLHFATLKPFDADAVVRALRRTPLLVTVEEHNVLAGFGSAVAEVMAESGVPGRLERVGFADRFAHEVGSAEHIMRAHGLTAEAIALRAQRMVGLRAA